MEPPEVPAVRLLRSNVLLELSAAKFDYYSDPESLKRRSCTLTSGKSGRLSVYGIPLAVLPPFPAFEVGRSDVVDF